jgi:ribosomal protein L11
MIDSNYRYKKRNYIQSQKADPSPPLGTILGNLGVIL